MQRLLSDAALGAGHRAEAHGHAAASLALVGMYFLGESRNTLTFVSLALLLSGIIGRRLAGEH